MQREQGSATVESGLELATSAPRWVKVFGAIVIVLIALVGIMMLLGGHGPGVHTPYGR